MGEDRGVQSAGVGKGPAGAGRDRGGGEDRSRKPGQTVVEMTSGNTGIGLAMVCAPRAIRSSSPWRRASASSAQADAVSGRQGDADAGSAARHGRDEQEIELARTHAGACTRQFENEADGRSHRERRRADRRGLQGQPLDYWVTGYGTGGTLKGVARVLRRKPEHQDRGVRADRCGDADQRRRRSEEPTARRRRVIRRSSRIRCRAGRRTSSRS